jgi:hypothetical protein
MIAKHDQSPRVLFDKSSVDRPGRSQIVVAIEDFLDAFTVLLEKLDRVFCNVGRHWPDSDGRPPTGSSYQFSDRWVDEVYVFINRGLLLGWVGVGRILNLRRILCLRFQVASSWPWLDFQQ